MDNLILKNKPFSFLSSLFISTPFSNVNILKQRQSREMNGIGMMNNSNRRGGKKKTHNSANPHTL